MKKSTLMFIVGAVVAFFGYKYYQKRKADLAAAAAAAAAAEETPVAIGGGGGGGGGGEETATTAPETESTTSDVSTDTNGKIVVPATTTNHAPLGGSIYNVDDPNWIGCPSDIDYLNRYGGVAAQVAEGRMPSGFYHYAMYGKAEGRTYNFDLNNV